MNKASQKFYNLMDTYLMNDKNQIDEFSLYPCNFGYKDLKHEEWMPQKTYGPYKKLLEQDKESNTMDYSGSINDIEFES